MDNWRRRQRFARELRFKQQIAENRAAWRDCSQIQDLRDPHGKRFLFDLSRRWYY
jgi:hypothetical protein